jgi:hypothetical protein
MIKRSEPWDKRSTISRWAHVLERTGLALTGASCGLFVAAHVGRADIELIGSAATVLAMMVYGAAGFYLGIDLPPVPPDHHMHLPLRHGLGSKWDTVELLSAAGTFLAAAAAVVSVSSIVLDETARAASALLISFGWGIGTTMQIAAGIIARTRAEVSTTL